MPQNLKQHEINLMGVLSIVRRWVNVRILILALEGTLLGLVGCVAPFHRGANRTAAGGMSGRSADMMAGAR